MGFFDKLFGEKADEAAADSFGHKMTVLAPMDGKFLPQDQLPDEVFSKGVLGPGCGIEPTGDTVYAPFDGTVTQLASTLHAVTLTSDDGIELMIHVGINTVEMGGKGFSALVEPGTKVKAGEPLLHFDCDAIRAAGHSTATAVVATNGDTLPAMQTLAEGDLIAGTPMLKF